MTTDSDPRQGREVSFHDAWAHGTPSSQVRVREAFESPTSLENAFILRRMGDLHGKRVLDLGSGLGEGAVYFALCGADATASDVSPGMIELARQLARDHGVSIGGVVSPAESLALPDASFDFVYAANLLHHVADPARVFAEARRVLKPGGQFFSWDPLAYNPLIAIYRRMATAVRTEDERPVTFALVEELGRHFEDCGHREFWLAGLSLFLKYYLVDRVDPNQERYWKRILAESERSLWWWMPLQRLDEVLTRVPGVQRLAWNMVLWGRKPGGACSG